MNKYKLLVSGIALGLGMTAIVSSFGRTIDIRNDDYNHVVTDIIVFHSNNKDNNATSVSCKKTDIIGPGQDCLIQYSSKAKATITFKVKSKIKDPKGNFKPMADGEVYSMPDGTLINFYPSYLGPINGSSQDYSNENNYASVDVGYNFSPDGSVSNPNRNDVINITSM